MITIGSPLTPPSVAEGWWWCNEAGCGRRTKDFVEDKGETERGKAIREREK